MKAPSEIERPLSQVPDHFTVTREQTSPPGGSARLRTLRQFLRFGLVGSLNTLVDLLILNALLWLFPSQNAFQLLLSNSIAYGFGAINSFLLNKYWTFGHRQKTTLTELGRFAVTTCLGILTNDLFIWIIGSILHPFISNPTIWTNTSKILAIAGSISISYLGMRIWVFTRKTERRATMHTSTIQTDHLDGVTAREHPQGYAWRPIHSLSVVLPAHNEEHIITSTVISVLTELAGWNMDFEVIVVDDGSTDRTGELVAKLARVNSQVRLVTHEVNRGYGAALTSGFAMATKELTFFMDSDGQFTIDDLQRLFPFIDEYEAVLGYRQDRQDAPLRKWNAWGWKLIVGLVLGVHARDIDCAFKLLHTRFLQEDPLETGSALINAELLYKLTRAGYEYKEVDVRHLPRQGGRATGASMKVILRAFHDLFTYAWRWRREEQPGKSTMMKGTIINEGAAKK